MGSHESQCNPTDLTEMKKRPGKRDEWLLYCITTAKAFRYKVSQISKEFLTTLMKFHDNHMTILEGRPESIRCFPCNPSPEKILFWKMRNVSWLDYQNCVVIIGISLLNQNCRASFSKNPPVGAGHGLKCIK